MGIPPGKRVYACDVFYWIELPQNLIRFYFYGFILRDSMKKSMRNWQGRAIIWGGAVMEASARGRGTEYWRL